MKQAVSPLFRGAPRKIELLAELTKSNLLTKDERDSISFALLAVQFALRPEMYVAFNEYLAAWPPEPPLKASKFTEPP